METLWCGGWINKFNFSFPPTFASYLRQNVTVRIEGKIIHCLVTPVKILNIERERIIFYPLHRRCLDLKLGIILINLKFVFLYQWSLMNMKKCRFKIYLARMCSQTRLCGKSFSTNITMKWPIFESLYLGLVVSQVLLQIWQLDKGAPALRNVTFVWSLTWHTHTHWFIIVIDWMHFSREETLNPFF